MPEYIFIYDHDILNGKEESNYDPMEAILFFYPTSTPIDFQLPICSHVMGFCQILSNTFLSPPKLFILESGAKLFCIHEPNDGLITKSQSRTLTFVLYSDDATKTNITERCTFLYESFIFYTNKCLSCTFKNGSRSKSKYINNLISLLLSAINHRDRMSLIFHSSLFCDPNNDNFKSVDSLFYQTVINIMDSIKSESKKFGVLVLGGSIFFKKMLIMSQIPATFSNILCIVIDCLNNASEKTTKEIFSSIKKVLVDTEDIDTRNGVHLFNICVTHDRYIRLLNTACEKKVLFSKNCCSLNSFHYLQLYIERHSNMTLAFFIEDPQSNVISKEMLISFSTLCFSQLGNIANISNNITMSTIKERKCSVGQGNIWNVNFDQIDQFLSVENCSHSQNIAVDWEESLMKRVKLLHDYLTQENSLVEIQVKTSNESLSAVKSGSEETYTIKFSNSTQ